MRLLICTPRRDFRSRAFCWMHFWVCFQNSQTMSFPSLRRHSTSSSRRSGSRLCCCYCHSAPYRPRRVETCIDFRTDKILGSSTPYIFASYIWDDDTFVFEDLSLHVRTEGYCKGRKCRLWRERERERGGAPYLTSRSVRAARRNRELTTKFWCRLVEDRGPNVNMHFAVDEINDVNEIRTTTYRSCTTRTLRVEATFLPSSSSSNGCFVFVRFDTHCRLYCCALMSDEVAVETL